MSEHEAAYTSTTLQSRREALAEIELKVRRGREALAEAEASLADVSARHRALVAARLAGSPDAAELEILAEVVAATQQRDALLSVVLSFQEEHKAAEQALAAAEEAAQTAQAIATWDALSQQQQRAFERFAKGLREISASWERSQELGRQQQALVGRVRRVHPALRHLHHPSALATQARDLLRRIVTTALGPSGLIERPVSGVDPRLTRQLAEKPLATVLTEGVLLCRPIGVAGESTPAEEEEAS